MRDPDLVRDPNFVVRTVTGTNVPQETDGRDDGQESGNGLGNSGTRHQESSTEGGWGTGRPYGQCLAPSVVVPNRTTVEIGLTSGSPHRHPSPFGTPVTPVTVRLVESVPVLQYMSVFTDVEPV